MTAADASVAILRRLLAEIRADRTALETRSDDVRSFADAAGTSSSRQLAAALALALDRAYTTLESILERIARTMEGGIPEGPDWHRALLRNAALDIAQVRPPVIRPETMPTTDELRRFRHFLRHAYAVELDLDRLLPLARRWLDSFAALSGDLDSFERFLEEMTDRIAATTR